MRYPLLIAVSALLEVAAPGPALAASAASLFVNPCGPQVVPPPCAAVQHPLGQPVTFWVIARDAQLALATNYAGTVAIASSDPAATLPPPHAFTPADDSIFAFTVTFNSPAGGPSPATQTVTATDAANGIAASALFFVAPASAAVSIPALSATMALLLGALLSVSAWLALRRRIDAAA